MITSTRLFREPVAGFTHLVGAVFAIVALCILSTQATLHSTVWQQLSLPLFGVTMLLMFASSALYHLVHGSEQRLTRLKRIDHMAIFLLIAGTYSPICLVPLQGPLGWTLFGAIWACAAAGIALKIFWIQAPRWLSTLIYLVMGWLLVPAIGPAIERIPANVLWWLVAGGAFYTVGAIIYALKWPNPWPTVVGFHEIWHVFVMIAVFCHFWAIAFGLADVNASSLDNPVGST